MCGVCSRRGLMLAALSLATGPVRAAVPKDLVEPRLLLPAESAAGERVALTLDACPGAFDFRLASALVEFGVLATVFATATWMRQNPSGLAFLRARPDLFAIENHGAHHIPPVLGDESVFGIAPAGDLDNVVREVAGGGTAIRQATGRMPVWYRAATGFYSPQTLPTIVGLGFGIAGYSLNADLGASLPQEAVARRVAGARDRDVIVGHVNQPHRASGAGLVDGVRALRERGVRFVHLPFRA